MSTDPNVVIRLGARPLLPVPVVRAMLESAKPGASWWTRLRFWLLYRWWRARVAWGRA